MAERDFIKEAFDFPITDLEIEQTSKKDRAILEQARERTKALLAKYGIAENQDIAFARNDPETRELATFLTNFRRFLSDVE